LAELQLPAVWQLSGGTEQSTTEIETHEPPLHTGPPVHRLPAPHSVLLGASELQLPAPSHCVQPLPAHAVPGAARAPAVQLPPEHEAGAQVVPQLKPFGRLW
jgi:hypothetical protein